MMVHVCKYTYSDEHCILGSLCCVPETNMRLYVNYTSKYFLIFKYIHTYIRSCLIVRADLVPYPGSGLGNGIWLDSIPSLLPQQETSAHGTTYTSMHSVECFMWMNSMVGARTPQSESYYQKHNELK